MTAADKRALWKERLAAWKASGESMRAFSQRHGWAPRRLAWWKNRLMDKPAVTPALIPVVINAAGAGNSIRLSGAGWTLELPGATAADWLAELLRSL